MAESNQHEVTRLLERWRGGDRAALEQLTPLVYEELRRLAHRYMRREHQGHPLQTTALVHEAYVRLIDRPSVPWQSRAHFLGVAAQAMRHILVDYARQKHAGKRGGGARRVALDDGAVASVERAAELVALDDAMHGLAALHPRRSRVVELRYFGGMNNREAAEVLGISEATVQREWRFARAWLYRELARQ
jgi:RNA polymerase sigma factor (TIGR02999 family)